LLFLAQVLQINDEFRWGQVEIIYNASNPIIFGTSKFNGTIYADKASIDAFWHGGDNILNGNFSTGGSTVEIGNNAVMSSSLIFAPNAFVQIEHATISGSIIADTFQIRNNGTVTYKQPEMTEDFILSGDGTGNQEGYSSDNHQKWELKKGALIEK